jgi:hypothetical protein
MLKTRSFVLSLSKHERRNDAPFDKLRVHGDSLSEEHHGQRRFSGEYVFLIMDSLVMVKKLATVHHKKANLIHLLQIRREQIL